MGLKKGEKVEPLRGPVRVVNTRKEVLKAMTDADCVKEGFPAMDRVAFINMLCSHKKTVNPNSMVNRIEFEYTD